MGSMPAAIRKIVDESGWGKLYEGLPSILFRQISFGMMKFLVFDFFTGKPFDHPRLLTPARSVFLRCIRCTRTTCSSACPFLCTLRSRQPALHQASHTVPFCSVDKLLIDPRVHLPGRCMVLDAFDAAVLHTLLALSLLSRFCVRPGALPGGSDLHTAFGVPHERAGGRGVRGDRVATRWDTCRT